MMSQQQDALAWRIEELYDWYGRPLEAEHAGAYLVVAGHGDYVFGPDERAVVEEALARFGPGCWLFRIGPAPDGQPRQARRLARG